MLYINQRIKELLSELEIVIAYDPDLDSDGRYIAEFNFIAHNCLDSFDRLLNGSKLERVANNFLIDETVAQYLSTNDLEPEQVNYVTLLANIGLDDSYLPVIQMSLKRQYHA